MIQGSIVALITPFNEDGSVNYDRLRELVDWHIEEGTDAILALGTTAETPTLTMKEEDEIARIVIEQTAGRVPVIVGSGSNNTMMAVEQSLKFQEMGADALLVITPYYNKTSKAGMVYHFTQVADAVDIPVYVYNVPGRTGVSITYEALAEISQHKNIVGIKEASGNISQIAKVKLLCGDDVDLYSGNDDQVVPILSLGGIGVISVLSNVAPKETHDMVMDYLNGDLEKAREMQLKALPLIDALFSEVNPIPVKKAMSFMGWEAGPLRAPLSEMEDAHAEVLRQAMKDFGIKVVD